MFDIGNHFNSKGGDDPAFGRFQEPRRSSEVQRRGSATDPADIFQGNAQVLDHILVSPGLQAAGRPAFDVVHINAEFADQASDHDPPITWLKLNGRGH